MHSVDKAVIDFYKVLYEGGIIEDKTRVYRDGCIYTYNNGALYKACGSIATLLKEFDK